MDVQATWLRRLHSNRAEAAHQRPSKAPLQAQCRRPAESRLMSERTPAAPLAGPASAPRLPVPITAQGDLLNIRWHPRSTPKALEMAENDSAAINLIKFSTCSLCPAERHLLEELKAHGTRLRIRGVHIAQYSELGTSCLNTTLLTAHQKCIESRRILASVSRPKLRPRLCSFARTLPLSGCSLGNLKPHEPL